MRIPVMQGIIDRRILVNYRVEPEAIRRVLPPPFEPQLVAGWAVAGICLIRLRALRPRWLPVPWGLGSENAAHRVAVEWTDDNGDLKSGVYIPRRDTNSWLNTLAGGRVFPGLHHHARFVVDEQPHRLSVAMTSDDGRASVRVVGRVADELPPESIFASLAEASAFFAAGSLGYSPTHKASHYEGLELCCEGWSVEALTVEELSSHFFADETAFPPGAASLDHALLMRGIRHQWHGRSELCCPSSTLPSPAAAITTTPAAAN